MSWTPEDETLWGIFRPYAGTKMVHAEINNQRFVHYTSAEAAINIIKSKCIWMRKTSCMNDFMEVKHGLDCLEDAYNSTEADPFKNTLDAVFPGITPKVESLFDLFKKDVETGTYVTSFSEHDANEDSYGRLSMWRAYGNPAGVALVLKHDLFTTPLDALSAFTSPTLYLTVDEFKQVFLDLSRSVAMHKRVLTDFGEDAITSHALKTLLALAACTKHPGFKEEREWRIIYIPIISVSLGLKHEIQTFRGVPQAIYKIPLDKSASPVFANSDIPKILDRIIIGPTSYPEAIKEAFESTLIKAGIPDPTSLVVVSEIPLRY
jgi:Protein of unknown function (DUF2971)